MTLDDYKGLINGLVENPDTLPTGAGSLVESIGADLLERDNLRAEVETLKAKNAELRDANIQLYLAQSGGAQGDTEEEEKAEGLDVVDEFLSEIFKED